MFAGWLGSEPGLWIRYGQDLASWVGSDHEYRPGLVPVFTFLPSESCFEMHAGIAAVAGIV